MALGKAAARSAVSAMAKAPKAPEGDGNGKEGDKEGEEDDDEGEAEEESEEGDEAEDGSYNDDYNDDGDDDGDKAAEDEVSREKTASTQPKRTTSAKCAKVLAADSSPPTFAPQRPKKKKPQDFAGRTVVAQKRIGHAWANGPRVDLEHLEFVQEDFLRRQAAVARLRERMADKSRPGHELRVQRRWSCAALARLLLRRHCSWTPCVVATMADAVWDGDILQVHGLLLRRGGGGDVNARDARGQLVLNVSIQQQHEPITRLLLDRGADVDLQDDGSLTTPLISAIVMGNKALARKLLARGADVNLPDGDGLSPLAWAAMRGYLELVAQLLALGADVDRQDVEGWTPLHIACFKGYAEVVEYLLVSGKAALEREDVNGFTPFLFARIAENADIVRKIDSYAADVASGKGRRWQKRTARKKKPKPPVDLATVSPKKLLVTSKN
ncbi:hypothetical protein PybrP1_012772 [[Pythium] brassicae (nom. inval.)]|nr:hypothetical protein PybrP1_012772 [[Pythium] brassicae (nom. inval.)]